MKHNKQAWTIAVLFLLATCVLLGGWQINNGGGGGSSAFSALTGGTNTTATMTCGAGCTINTATTGLIIANNFSGTCAGTAPSAGTFTVANLGLPQSSAGTCAVTVTATSTLFGATVSNNCNAKNLAVTSSANGVNSSDGVATIYTGTPGVALTASSITCTLGATKACQDNTHQVAVTPGQIIVLGILSQASSTLANVSASIVCE